MALFSNIRLVLKIQRQTLVPGLGVTKENVFITLSPGVNVIKLFSFVADDKA